MALSWNEIKDPAVTFSKEWEDTSNEETEANPLSKPSLIFLELAVSVLSNSNKE